MLASILKCLSTASRARRKQENNVCRIPRLTAQAEFDRLRRQELQREALRVLACWSGFRKQIRLCGPLWAFAFRQVASLKKAIKARGERERESAKFNDTIHTPGDTRDQSLSPVTPKQTFLCDVKPWSSLEPMPFGIVAFSNAS